MLLTDPVPPRARARGLAASVLLHACVLAALFLVRVRVSPPPATELRIPLSFEPIFYSGSSPGGAPAGAGQAETPPRKRPTQPKRHRLAAHTDAPSPVSLPPEPIAKEGPANPAAHEEPAAGGTAAAGAGPGAGGEGHGTGTGVGNGDGRKRPGRDFRWIWRLDPGRYRVLAPRGYVLSVNGVFEGIQAPQLEILSMGTGQAVARLSAHGPFSWYDDHAERDRFFIFNGYDRAECRFAQVGAKGRIGFEDASDGDCNEPALLLELTERP
jgi:hypothetical protein